MHVVGMKRLNWTVDWIRTGTMIPAPHHTIFHTVMSTSARINVYLWLLVHILLLNLAVNGDRISRIVKTPEDGMVLSGLKGKALYLYNGPKGSLMQFPDFYTFSAMGYNMSSIRRMQDDQLLAIPRIEPLKKIQGPPPFRPDDWMYHNHCDDPPRLLNDLSVVANMGNFYRYVGMMQRVSKSRSIDILTLGGSITAGGYFLEFVRHLEIKEGLNVTVHNHGHGATELTCKLPMRLF